MKNKKETFLKPEKRCLEPIIESDGLKFLMFFGIELSFGTGVCFIFVPISPVMVMVTAIGSDFILVLVVKKQ